MARLVLTHSVTINLTADQAKKLGVDQALTFPKGANVVPDELVDHWMIKGVTAGEAMKQDDAKPALDGDQLTQAHADLTAAKAAADAAVAEADELRKKLEEATTENESLRQQLTQAHADLEAATAPKP